jgi:hypothetical protein
MSQYSNDIMTDARLAEAKEAQLAEIMGLIDEYARPGVYAYETPPQVKRRKKAEWAALESAVRKALGL